MDLRNPGLSLFNQRRSGTLLFSLWEPLLKPVTWNDDKSFDAIRWHRQTPLSKFILYSLYVFKTLKSSSTWFIPASLYEGPFFYFYVELVFLLLSVSEANTCVNFVCNNFYMLVYCTYYISLCWQYTWNIICWKLKDSAET